MPPKDLVKIAMLVCDKSASAVLTVFLAATAHKFYFNELKQETGLTAPTLSKWLKRLVGAGYVHGTVEGTHESLGRFPRHYYAVTSKAVYALRLNGTAQETIILASV